MRTFALAVRFGLLTAAILGAGAGCEADTDAAGARGPCAAGGQLFGEPGDCDPVESIEDACWKLVECGVIPLDRVDPGGIDWGRCVTRLEDFDPTAADVAVACVGAASCDALAVNDSPANPFEWPDCLEYR